MTRDDDPPSEPPDHRGALLKNSDFFAIAKIYGGLAYLGSIAGSPAERARLRRGDVVLAVNGHPTPDLMSFLHARSKREGGATVRFVRDGVEQEVELVWDTLRHSQPPVDLDVH
jgi:S1-C subfamily serine protease